MKLTKIVTAAIVLLGLTWSAAMAQEPYPTAVTTPVTADRGHNLPLVETQYSSDTAVLLPYIRVHVCRSWLWIWIDDCDSDFVRPVPGAVVQYKLLDPLEYHFEVANQDGIATYEGIQKHGNYHVSVLGVDGLQDLFAIVSVDFETAADVHFVAPPRLFIPFVSR